MVAWRTLKREIVAQRIFETRNGCMKVREKRNSWTKDTWKEKCLHERYLKREKVAERKLQERNGCTKDI